MAFLLDANILIAPSNSLPFDVFPTFWSQLEDVLHSDQFLSIDLVRNEIYCKPDELTNWCEQHFKKEKFIETITNSSIHDKYIEVINWANNLGVYNNRALKDFCNPDKADAHLVATAAALGHTVVTFEKSSPKREGRVMIPDACNAFSVKFCDPITALRSLKIVL